MSFPLDRRSRRDEDRHPISPAGFFTKSFPPFAAANGHLAVAGMAALKAPPLTVEVDGAEWTLARVGDGLLAREGRRTGSPASPSRSGSLRRCLSPLA